MSPIINKRLEKQRRSNLKFMSAVNNEIKRSKIFLLPTQTVIVGHLLLHLTYFITLSIGWKTCNVLNF
jgi:hypothetical protein